jgi:hypothetical protein
MSVFVPCEGGVFRVKAESNTCTSTDRIVAIKVENFSATAPITGFSLDLGTNHQFLHTLDEFIYVYSFGDRLGQLTLSGIGFTECTTQAGGSPSGVFGYYMKNRLARTLTPTTITVAGYGVLLGFLTGIRMDIPNPAFPIMQWTLQYSVILDAPPLTAPLTDRMPDAGDRAKI